MADENKVVQGMRDLSLNRNLTDRLIVFLATTATA